jgi:peptidoglycan/xylan/chitin deacetylase (PgdA/CDA1 family)
MSLMLAHVLTTRLPSSILWTNPTENRDVYLTFDDGPHREHTPRILDTLSRYDAKATFLVLGKWAEAQPDLVVQLIDSGHTVGNHTYSHTSLWFKNKKYVAREIELTDRVLYQIVRLSASHFRPPHGALTPAVLSAARESDKKVLMWTINTRDYSARSDEGTIIKRVLAKVRPGSIILFHDGNQRGHRTVSCIEKLIPALQSRGYTVSALPTKL